MTWLTILKLTLQLVAYFAKQAERKDIEKAAHDALENLHGKRVDAAVAANDDVVSGRVRADPQDPNRRD
jgi:hypothetical protein